MANGTQWLAQGRQIVGTSCGSSGLNCRAVLWQAGAPTDLNTLVSPSGTAVLTTANGIDDPGRIAGTALHNGKAMAYKATSFLTVRQRRESKHASGPGGDLCLKKLLFTST